MAMTAFRLWSFICKFQTGVIGYQTQEGLLLQINYSSYLSPNILPSMLTDAPILILRPSTSLSEVREAFSC